MGCKTIRIFGKPSIKGYKLDYYGTASIENMLFVYLKNDILYLGGAMKISYRALLSDPDKLISQ